MTSFRYGSVLKSQPLKECDVRLTNDARLFLRPRATAHYLEHAFYYSLFVLFGRQKTNLSEDRVNVSESHTGDLIHLGEKRRWKQKDCIQMSI